MNIASLGLRVDSAEVEQGASSLDKLSQAGGKAEAAARKFEQAADKATESVKDQKDELAKLLAQIDPATRALGKLDEQERKLLQARKAGLIDSDSFRDYQSKIASAREALAVTNDTLARTGITAKQTAAALRGVPAQFTDIVVSLQGGQAPLTVLLQQGGQLKDMFGGIGPAAKALGGYISGLINPLTVTAAGVGLLGYAFYDAERQASAFNKSLFAGNGTIGVSSNQLAALASSTGKATGDLSEARDAFMALASAGNLSNTQLRNLGQAASAAAEYSGKAASDLAKQFAGLGSDATEAAGKASSQFGLVTAAQYEVIRALDDQGEHAKALDVLSEELNRNAMQRLTEYKSSVSGLEQDWNAVKTAISGAYAAVKSSLFPDINAQIADAERRLKVAESGSFDFLGRNSGSADRIRTEVADLKKIRDEQERNAQSTAELNEANQKYILTSNQLNAQLDKVNPLAKREADVKKLKDQFIELMQAEAITGKRSPLLVGVEYDGQNFSGGAYDKLLKEINESNKDKKGPSEPINLASFNDAENSLKSIVSTYQNAEKELEAAQRAGVISQESYSQQRASLIKQEQAEIQNAYKVEIAALESAKSRSSTSAEQRIQLDQKIVDARAAMVRAQQDADSKLEVLATNEKGRLKKQELAVKNYTDALNQQIEALRLQGERSTLSAGMGSRQSDFFQQQNALDDRLAQQKIDLANQYGDGSRGMSLDEYNDKLKALEDNHNGMTSQLRANYDKLTEAQGDWTNGARGAFQDYLDSAQNVAGQTRDMFSNAFSNMEDGIVDFVKTGKLSFKDFANSLIEDLIRIQVRQAAAGLLSSAFSGGSSLFGGSGTITGFSEGHSYSLAANAKGGVYDSPSLSAYSGKVYDSPQFFAFAKGAGVFGEAGPEAIMPLTRAADGSLGVRATGGASSTGDSASITQTFHINGDVSPQTVAMIQQATKQATIDAYQSIGKDFKQNGPLRQMLRR